MSNIQKKKRNEHLLNKLYHRQITGRFPHSSQGHVKVPLFNRLVERLAFQLDKVIPLSALEAGHVLLGFSKCGQFLLTYTISVELEVNLLTVVHKYKLHWWSFVPYRKATKVTEVTLFADQGVHLPLQIVLCYWPSDTSKILIHGSSTLSDTESRECFMTITSVPSLNGCRDCIRIAESYGDEELAASWDSCVRFSCLRHGWTIHSNYSTVPPYPSFVASVSLRNDGVIVINTANFLHVLTAQVEFPKTDETVAEDLIFATPQQSVNDIQQLQQEWEDETSDDSPFPNVRATPTRTTPPRTLNVSTRCFTTSVVSPLRSTSGSFKKRLTSPSPSRNNPAESEYDFMEDASEIPRETISAFRKRRLADKKYEFKDENTENVPLKILRRRTYQLEGQVSPGRAPVVVSFERNKDSNEDWEWSFSSHSNDVLRPFNSNIPTPIRSPEVGNDEPLLVRDHSMKLPQLPSCVVQFTRRYFEVDDELVSVITDIEDDDLSSSTGYHNALPLEVHGTGYAQMQMVSNSKALKLNVPHVLVKQTSIDTEQFCHEMAQRLCTLSHKKYWFCTDFNVEIIDICLETNDVIATAFMLVEADTLQANQKIQRSLCQASVYFAWNMESGQYRIIDFDLPVEITPNSNNSSNRCSWHPARDVGRRLRKELLTPTKPVYTLTNIPELTGRSLSVIYDPSWTFAIVL